MNLNQLQKALPGLYAAKTPIFLWGPPGIGKTFVINSFVHDMGVPLHFFDMGTADAIDIGRFPVPNKDLKKLDFYKPAWMPEFNKGVLLFDEFNANPNKSIMLCANKILLERGIGEYKLPEDVWIVCTGNRLSDNAMANNLPTSTANRILHLNIEFDAKSFVDWSYQNGVNKLIPAFVERFPELAYTFDPKAKGVAFSSPRTLTELSKHIGIYPDELKMEVYQGLVGQSTGSTFYHFEKLFNALPSPKTILNDPKNASIPSDLSVLFVTCVGLQNIADKSNLESIYEYSKRLSDQMRGFLMIGIYKSNKNLNPVTSTYKNGIMQDFLLNHANMLY